MEILKANLAHRSQLVSLLAKQLSDHGISTPLQKIEFAIDGVLSEERRGVFLLALEKNNPLGVAYLAYHWSVEHGGKSAWLEELYVLPEQREKGVGSQLLKAVVDLARRENCAAVDLEVEANHQRVEKLYARHQFKKHSRSRWVLPLVSP